MAAQAMNWQWYAWSLAGFSFNTCPTNIPFMFHIHHQSICEMLHRAEHHIGRLALNLPPCSPRKYWHTSHIYLELPSWGNLSFLVTHTIMDAQSLLVAFFGRQLLISTRTLFWHDVYIQKAGLSNLKILLFLNCSTVWETRVGFGTWMPVSQRTTPHASFLRCQHSSQHDSSHRHVHGNCSWRNHMPCSSITPSNPLLVSVTIGPWLIAYAFLGNWEM